MLTLEVIPYQEIEHLSSVGRIRKLLNSAKEDKIVLLQGRLKKEEEAELIRATMEEINDEFKGIELAVIDPGNENVAGLQKFTKVIYDKILGDRTGLTVIGPASIIKQVKKDPKKIQLLMQEGNNKKRVKKKR
ncbi:TPA: DUF2073 domain-containing protein [Candidatus Woesearchaeota archaeon]|nr:MAG: hypothetical protein QS99_C0010G0032 [archaeon GW2011_AR4]HIH38195.1 DUF2073 domain-containing protein [Candidatus Woesearchaeota archaeon]HIH49490.1 DUF2073 domain-containing protein [Candidatus Woesearchaeota archaeon]HIJ03872.1 DUF2073 domain-containing protein [Candidatus Woesearchaeota archaeon]